MDASYRLLLNPSKTQFIWLSGRRQLVKVDLRMLADTFPHIAFSTTVRDLGLTLEQHNNNNNNLRVSNIMVSNRTLIYNVCPKSALP